MTVTYDDAGLLVQLARWGTEMGLEDALGELFADDFDPAASHGDPAIRKALWFFETVSTLVKHAVLSRELVLDVWWVPGIWSRVAPHVERARAGSGEPRLYENLEALAVSVGA